MRLPGAVAGIAVGALSACVPDVRLYLADAGLADTADGGLADTADGGDAPPTLPQRSCPSPDETGCGMVVIPGGSVALGAEDLGEMNTRPVQDRITVSAFALDRAEVSVARFRRYFEAGMPAVAGGRVSFPGGVTEVWSGPTSLPDLAVAGHEYLQHCRWTPTTGWEDHPINCVTWQTAMAFCVWDGGRLPTEAEWELAARGGEGRAHPWGPAWPAGQACWARCTTPGSCTLGTCPVEDPTFAAGRSPEGAWQLAGGVWEWTADGFQDYTDTVCWGGQAQVDPLCTPRSARRTIRGGGWMNTRPVELHAAFRGWAQANDRDQVIGFRCARSL